MRILFASSNKGKLSEIRWAAGERGFQIVSPGEIAKEQGLAPLPEPEENAPTYLENAALKADSYFGWCRVPSLADDTGLEVDALKGGPGLYSARYAGPEKDPAKNIDKLLTELAGERNRSARFRCSLFLRLDAKNTLVAEDFLEGSIAEAPRGGGGFGYDSVFVVRGTESTLAELKQAGEGACVTHRILAARKLFACLAES